MTKFFYLFLSLMLLACSTTRTKRKVFVPEGEPEWLYAASTGCGDAEICASGEGASFKEADAHAKKALAGIFETKIKAEFNFSKQNFSNQEKIEIREYVEDQVNQQIDLVLKGSFIKERFTKEGLKFALASLKKAESLNILTQELTKIDDEMDHFFKLRNRLYIKKLNMLFNKREILNEKIIILNATGIPRRITFSQINELKFKSSGSTRIKLESKGDIPSVLLKKIEETFTDVGYKITKKADQSYLIHIGFKELEEYLNVRGFKKYTFIITIDSKNNTGKRVGGYVLNLTSNGRDKKDAFLKVRSKIITQIEENLAKLNLN